MKPYHGAVAPAEFQRISAIAWHKSVTGMAIVDCDGRFRRINPAFSHLVEYTEAELEGKHFAEITHPADIDADKLESARVIEGESDGYVMRKRYLSKTGRIVWITLRVDAVPRPDGTLEFFYIQISPADQVSPPTFPGQPERQADDLRTRERLKLVKWGIGLLIGSGVATAGAITDNEALISMGSMVVMASVGGAAVEGKLK